VGYFYTPFSASVHSTWHHISRLNLQVCENPLHRYHKTPIDPDLPPEPDYLYRAAKYVQKTFTLFDATFSVQVAVPSAFDQLVETLNNFGEDSKDNAAPIPDTPDSTKSSASANAS